MRAHDHIVIYHNPACSKSRGALEKDQNFKDLGLDATDFTEAEQVARLLAENPKLMQRPVVVRGERAVIARPSEKVASLL